MNTFQPLGCGFGRSILPTTSPATSTSEPTTMAARKNESIGDIVLRLIGEAGGTLSAAELSDKMPDVADANRGYHVRKLVLEGQLTATGKTSDRSYSLAGTPAKTAKGTVKASSNASKPEAPAKPFDQFEHAESEASAVLAARTDLVPSAQPDININVAIVRPVLEDQHNVVIDPAFLRRVLRLALSVPGEISNADRQALHAIALAS
jgi:hypothetical protein